MTKVQNPIIGRARGSAGGMTFSKNSDQNVMRAKAFEVNNPKTTAQTTQRDFFKEVQSVVDSVSPEQLRSLFGDKPKKMSRRNALFKQVAAAYSVDGTTKSVDFSKLLAIGNGEKVKTEIYHVSSLNTEAVFEYDKNDLGIKDGTNPNIIIVLFDATVNKIYIANTDFDACGRDVDLTDFNGKCNNHDVYFYLTISTKSERVAGQSFGSFIIKTRGTTKSSAPAQS